MRLRFALPLEIALLVSLAVCGTSSAREFGAYELSDPSIVILNDDIGEKSSEFSYIVEIDTNLGQPAEYGYPTLGSLPPVGPVPAVKPRRASLKPPAAAARTASQFRREIAPKARRVSISSVSSSRRISARLPIIVGLFR